MRWKGRFDNWKKIRLKLHYLRIFTSDSFFSRGFKTDVDHNNWRMWNVLNIWVAC